MKWKYQKREKYLPLEEVLREVKKEIEFSNTSNSRLNNLYGSKISTICHDLFGITATVKIEDTPYLFETGFPSLPGVRDLTVRLPELMDDKKRDEYLKDNLDRLEKFKSMQGSIDYKKIRLKGGYSDFSFSVKVDMDRLFRMYDHTAKDVTAILLNEIGKMFSYVDYIDATITDIHSLRLKPKKMSIGGVVSAIQKTHKDSLARAVDMRRVMDSYDDMSSEFTAYLGWGSALVEANVMLERSYQSVNNRRFLRALPTIGKAAFNIIVASWLAFIATVSHVYTMLRTGNLILMLLTTMVLIIVFGLSLLVVMMNIVYASGYMLFAETDTVHFSHSRYKSVRKVLVKQIKELKGKASKKEINVIKEHLSTLELLSELIPKDDGFLDKLFSTKDSNAMIDELKSNDLYVRNIELMALAI